MIVNKNDTIYALENEYYKSEGHVAIVDDDKKLIGIYGKKEHERLIQDITSRKCNAEADCIINYINPSFTCFVKDEYTDAELEDLLSKMAFTYVPIVSKDGTFLYFCNNEKSKEIGLEWARIKEIVRFWSGKDERLMDDNESITCKVCGNKIRSNTSEKKISMCIFGGGRLERYVCSICGCIVGPIKMAKLTESEIALDYKRHYSIFSEGDTTEDEIKTFFLLNPKRDKRYLNYGCGGEWSKSIDSLRKQGYDVWGYEPFATKTNTKYIITDKAYLKKEKFDGVFSNNLLEHLVDPYMDLLFMKSLLADDECLMVHSTACYHYMYEYTRFHLSFFEGKSAGMLFDKIGMKSIKYVEEILHNDLYCAHVIAFA